jgi:hypothetical protein
VSDKDILSVEEAAKGLSLKEETRKQENKKLSILSIFC